MEPAVNHRCSLQTVRVDDVVKIVEIPNEQGQVRTAVYKVRCLDCQKPLAVKQVFRAATDPNVFRYALNEKLFLHKLSKLDGVVNIYDGRGDQTEGDVLLLLDAMDYSLHDIIADRLEDQPQFIVDESFARSVVYNVLVTLDKLHNGCSCPEDTEFEVAHRDIKPANILLKKIRENDAEVEFQVVLADLAMAKTSGQHKESGGLATNLGTPGYKDPEFFADPNETKTFEQVVLTDLFALGTTMAELLTGHELECRKLGLYEVEADFLAGLDGNKFSQDTRTIISVLCVKLDNTERMCSGDILQTFFLGDPPKVILKKAAAASKS